jgi:hypothetical protein
LSLYFLNQKRTSKLQKKPLALKREHPALQNMKLLNFFLFLWVIFVLMDPDSDSVIGSTDLIESGSGSYQGILVATDKNIGMVLLSRYGSKLFHIIKC